MLMPFNTEPLILKIFGDGDLGTGFAITFINDDEIELDVHGIKTILTRVKDE